MQCPVCDAKLRAVEKHGVEVDICPDCKGVWLDRGELDKILDMAAQGGPAPVEQVETRRPEREYRSDDRGRHEERRRPEEYEDRRRDERRYEGDRYREPDRDYDPRTGKHRRKSSWLGEIFDAFGGGGED